MRALTFCTIAFALGFSGCHGSHECPTKTESEAKSSVTDGCSDGSCCSNLSRSAILKKSEETETAITTVELKTTKFQPFIKDIQSYKGKVVCLYQWGQGHAPSKKHLGDVIALHQKLATPDLVGVTLSTDEGETRKETLKHLQAMNCKMINYSQDENETVETWDSIFGCCGNPTVVIYGRDGKQAASFLITAALDMPAVEKAIVKELSHVK